MKATAPILACVVLIAEFAVPGTARAAAGDMTVLAAPGPLGMTVRWFPRNANAPLTATLVRVEQNGRRSAPIAVNRPVSRSAALKGLPDGVADIAAFNTRIDAKKQGILAEIGPLPTAIARGVAYVDADAAAPNQYRYEVRLSDGEHGSSNLSPKAGAKPRAARYAIHSMTATGGDRAIAIAADPAQRGGFVRVYRDDGAGFHAVAVVPCSRRGGVSFSDRVPPDRSYTYRVAFVDLFDNEGPVSPTATARAKDLHRPNSITGILVRPMGRAVMVSWKPLGDAAVGGYDVFRAPANGPFSRIATVDASRASYADAASPGTIYRYDVRAHTRAGIQSYASGGTALHVPKLVPPDAPLHLTTKALADGVTLTWPPSRDGTVRRYEVYQRAGTGRPVLLAQLPSSAREYRVPLVVNAPGRYSYGVGVQDRFGNRTAPAAWTTGGVNRTARALAFAPLALRTGARGIAISLVPLRDPDVTGQVVYRSTDGGKPVRLARIDATATRFDDASAQRGHDYAYSVAALTRDGTASAPSKPAAVRYAGTTLAAPAPQARVLADGLTVELQWPSARGIAGFQIVRRDPDGATSTIAPLVRAFSYRDTIAPGRRGTFAYALRVVGSNGVSAPSRYASVTIAK